jgi:hypothetical protein
MELLNKIYKFLGKTRKVYLRKNKNPIQIIGMLRIRNEELILEDTLDYLSSFCDGIVCFEDASTDSTYQILKKTPKVLAVIRNFNWLPDPDDRIKSETFHRYELLQLCKEYNPEWILCADADERIIGDVRGFINSTESEYIDIVRISLFDAYITIDDQQPYRRGANLCDFRSYFGPERRDIIMMWRNNNDITFQGLDCREPVFKESMRVTTAFHCQHYGKSLSIEHWEETCRYYIDHFPYEPYGRKWADRRGKAVHVLSDFSTPLYLWGEELFGNHILIHPGG